MYSSSMGILLITTISMALAMDAFAVSIAGGISKKNISTVEKIKLALFFGIFQGVMPLIGFYFGHSLPFDMSIFDHWIALILLSLIGINMIRESLGLEDEDKKNYFSNRSLFMSAIATSIDAFATGFSFSLLNQGIIYLAISATIITSILSYLGVFIGNRYGHIFERRAEMIGGVALILIGVKIFLSHIIT